MAIIEECENWYKNKELNDFHVRKNLNNKEEHMSRMNFAKRCCADDANLCEIISIVSDKTEETTKQIREVMKNSSFEVQYRKQLEKVSATGTVGAYIYLQDATYVKRKDDRIEVKGGKIKINYVDADCVIPLTVEDDLITECAFAGTDIVKGKEHTTLVIFTRENGLYKAKTVVFNKEGTIVQELCTELQLGEIKPFAIMQNAEVNNLDDMIGYGLPKIYGSIPLFKAVDLCYNLLYGDLDKAEKIVFINELLSCVKKNKDGEAVLTKKQQDLFILLGDKLPEQDSVIKEYNPQIRVEEITKAFELVLSLLSLSFGYGTKKYTFENGQIKTATEYIGTKQDSMQELNKQRKQAEDYIKDLMRAALWFANQFHGKSYNLEEGLSIEFDDSYVEDRVTKLNEMRADALSFAEIPWLRYNYLKEKYNLSEEDAKKYIQEGQLPNEEDEIEE